jgi:hypothetical protein
MALDRGSVDRLELDGVPLPTGVLDHGRWQAFIANSLLAEQTHL